LTGRVVLVGAGPGDPDLLTVRAAREIGAADVLFYDALINPALVDLAPEDCERIDVGKRGDGSRGFPQDRIAELMIERAREGKRVVRLKGGDPLVFGRGGEEASVLVDAGIPFEIVPGVSSAIAVPAYAGIPVTDRRLSSSVAVVTGHRAEHPDNRRIDWEGLSRSAETLVVLMGTAWLPEIVTRVIAGGRDPKTPAAVVERGTTPDQRVVVAPLEDLPERVREAGLRAPTIIVIGEVVRFRERLAWYEKRPLHNRAVLVTRERDQGADLIERLRARGARPVHVPRLEFRLPEDPDPFDRALEKLDRYDWVVFTSANAVRRVADRLRELGRSPSELGTVGVGCVGPKTEAVARDLGISVRVVPPTSFLPEDLAVEMARRAPLQGARVLFPRARDARGTLPERLAESGARVDSIEAYRTELPEGAGETLGEAIQQGLDAVTLLSPSAVDHLARLLGDAGVHDLAGRTLFACIGSTTATALRERGVEPDLVCKEPTVEALVEALEDHFRRETP
jgi:uroporphyrinogen III methyltransferase/synthase